MRYCHIVPSLEERHGGTTRAVYAVSGALARLGHDVTLLATDPVTRSKRSEGSLHIGLFQRNRPQALCRSRTLWRHLQTTAPNVIHHHSIWLRTLHYARCHADVTGAPLVISPHGMMSAWAWHHHGWRKQIVRRLVHPGAFEAAAGWHATSEEEAADIRSLGFKQPICVAPNGVNAPTAEERSAATQFWREACPDVAQRPTALFYSRFHRKKRVLELIDLWLSRPKDDWLLLMVGLPDDYTAHQLNRYVMRASGGGRVRVFDGEGGPPPYAVASVFLLPSHSENFGLVIAEAMANGLPVLVTDATPWSSLNTHGAGWCVPWAMYGSTLETVLAASDAERAQRGECARVHAMTDFSWEQSAVKLVAFYQQLLAANA